MKKKTKAKILPSSEMILGVVNNEKNSIEELLLFYDKYILTASVQPAYSSEGVKVGYYIDEDLAQNIRTSIIESIPNLRKAIVTAINKEKESIFIVVSKI